MMVKRLSWAGVQLEAGGMSVVIDLFTELTSAARRLQSYEGKRTLMLSR
jgi:hypothetical protein